SQNVLILAKGEPHTILATPTNIIPKDNLVANMNNKGIAETSFRTRAAYSCTKKAAIHTKIASKRLQ
ncbi:MAG: hypothetical protein K2J60_02355, partial [Acetatifactor sp.]|nr:hypothetical protein [Acetatifactor sp.]